MSANAREAPGGGAGPLFFAMLRSGANALGRIRRQSRLKLAVVGVFAFGLPIVFYAVFLHALRFFTALSGMGFLLLRPLFSLFFLGLGGLLAFSAFAAAFPALFRSPEVEMLRAGPTRPESVLWYKWIEMALICSWAYFYIVLPFAAAYGRHEGYPARFMAATLIFSLPFVLWWTAAGLLACVGAARWLPRWRLPRATPVALALALTIAAVLLFRRARPPAADAGGELAQFLQRIAPGLRVSSHPLWPSAWFSEGVLAAARGAWGRALELWLRLAVNALMAGLAVEWAARRWLPGAWLRGADAARGVRRRIRGRRIGLRAPPGLPADVSALALKDARMFLRDPVQWAQGLFFFVLLALYFLNLRSLRYDRLNPLWRDLIAFLNLFSVASVACSFASRFVYPQLSLEGHAVWIVGLSPGGIRRAFAVKFTVAAGGLVGIAVALTALSTRMLRVGPETAGATIALAAGFALAAAGLSVGLGAVFLDLRQRNPSAIVSSFGGTLNLLLNLGLMFTGVLAVGGLFYARHALELPPAVFRRWLMLAMSLALAASLAATAIPLYLGQRSLRNRDF